MTLSTGGPATSSYPPAATKLSPPSAPPRPFAGPGPRPHSPQQPGPVRDHASPVVSLPSRNDEDLATVEESTSQRVSLEPNVLVHARYELLTLLGEGCLGSSWVAHDRVSHHHVVVKFIAEMLVNNERERADLAGKLEMFAGRTLPGVVMPREVFVVPGHSALVYPYVDGVSLQSVIDARRARGQPFTPEECLRVVMSLSAAMQTMHTASPHGALWPSNILVTARGLLLVDGFVSVSVAPNRTAIRLEHSPRARPYAAPEMLVGRRPTASADLYALGALVVDLVSGAPAGNGYDLTAVSSELHTAVATLLDREPSRRPSGLPALHEALVRISGLQQRPPNLPMLVPESVLMVPSREMNLASAAQLDPVTLPAPSLHDPQISPLRASSVPPSEPEVVTFAISSISAHQPTPKLPVNEPVFHPSGRFRGPTAPLPVGTARLPSTAMSGPPPTLAVKSGPPQPAAGPPPPSAALSTERSQRAPPRPLSTPTTQKPSLPIASVIPTVGVVDGRNFPKTLPSINKALSDAAQAMKANGPPRDSVKSSSPFPPASTVARPPSSVTSEPRPSVVSPPAKSVGFVLPRPAPPVSTTARPPLPSKPPATPPSVANKKPAVAKPERSLEDDDEIDPKLLRAARMLDDQRKRR
jgi:serine/threonine protein kinase